MADTRQNTPIPSGTWVNLYAASGIPVGEQLLVENVGTCDVNLVVQAAEPDPDHAAFNVVRREEGPLQNNQGDTGAWGRCNNTDGVVNISRMGGEGFTPSAGSAPSIGGGTPEDRLNTVLEFQTSVLVAMQDVGDQLRLLNLRFEEAFQTSINENDL